MLWVDRVANRRSLSILARTFLWKTGGAAQRKKKGQKERKKQTPGGLWKLTPLMEIRQERGFPQRLEKAKQTLLGFFTVPTGPTAGFFPNSISKFTRGVGQIR
jgi:hypothetical protein